MDQTAILKPVAALALWTLLVVVLIPYRRFKAAFAKQVTDKDFKYGESSKVPPDVSVPNRVYMNLLEAPLLFYVASVLQFQTHHVDQLAITLAWAYVALRVAHSLVYLTYNNVFHRLSVFGLSTAVLTVIWVRLGVRLLAA